MVTFEVGNALVVPIDMPAAPEVAETVNFAGKLYIVKSRSWSIDKGYYPEAGGDAARHASAELTVRLSEIVECACVQPASVSGNYCGRCRHSLRGWGVPHAREWLRC